MQAYWKMGAYGAPRGAQVSFSHKKGTQGHLGVKLLTIGALRGRPTLHQVLKHSYFDFGDPLQKFDWFLPPLKHCETSKNKLLTQLYLNSLILLCTPMSTN